MEEITLESTEFEITEQMTKFLIEQYVTAINGYGLESERAKSPDEAMVLVQMVRVFVGKAFDAGICSKETKEHSVWRVNNALSKKWGVSV